jgi:Protein of unknown function (DUF3891)
MFRSPSNVIVSQAEHGRMAGAIAAVWGLPQPLPLESLVRGVTLHDRGYGELDDDQIGVVEPERWVEIQRRGFSERSGDPAVDLVVALHIRRLIGDDEHPARVALAREIDAALPELREAAGLDEEEAQRADGVTETCDRLSFVYCSGEAAAGEVRGIRYRYDGAATIALDPWPLAVPWLCGVVGGFAGDGYPARLVPVVELFRMEPAE